MALRFGGELELIDGDVLTSTEEARKLFLSLVWELKPEIARDLMKLFNFDCLPGVDEVHDFDLLDYPSPYTTFVKFFVMHTKNPGLYTIDLTSIGLEPELRSTPVLAFFDFLFKNQVEYDELLKKSEAYFQELYEFPREKLITSNAIDELIPDWKSLKSKNHSELLRSELIKWASKWNLTEDWCMDFALNCLKKFKVDFIDDLRLPGESFQKVDYLSLWELDHYGRRGSAWHSSLFELSFRSCDASIPFTTNNYPTFRFDWTMHSDDGDEAHSIIDSFNPFVFSAASFQKKIEKLFWDKFFEHYKRNVGSLVGHTEYISDILKKLNKQIESHVSKCRKVLKPITRKTPVKQSGDQHFRWLIEYQINNPVEKSYRQIAVEYHSDGEVVRKGILSVSEKLGLQLRPATRTGRPKGIKESTERNNIRYW